MTGKLILYVPNTVAGATLSHDSGQSFFGPSIDGVITLGPFDLPDGNGATLSIDSANFRGVLWLSIKNPVNGSASFAIDTFPSFKKPFPLVPTREEVLGIGMHFRGGIIVNSLSFGKMPWWPPALSWCGAATRKSAYDEMHKAGDTHALIEVPNGLPLYNESGQFYSPDKFGPLDWTNGETSLDSRFSDLVDEVISEGFRYIIAMDERVDHSTRIVQLAMNALTDKQLQYGVVIPGYDAVFYGWQPQAITNWATIARSIKPNCYLGIEFNPGHIPLGNGPADYAPGGAMDGYDLILGEFFTPPVTGDGVWQILGRCIRPYNRPPQQIGDENPPFYLVDSPRGPRCFCAFETNYPYNWVRVDMNNQTAIDAMIKDIENETASYRQLGCRFVG